MSSDNATATGSAPPKVSVIVPVYRPGPMLDRVLDSLAAQTMPASDFEVIFVDDGSPDDTFERLQRIAATRPNTQALQVEHSGWPSRPRNVGIEHASGEYLLFMDHDDSLYPDGLRRAHEFAAENDADVVAIKESKSNDVWWTMAALDDGNLGNAADATPNSGMVGIDRLQPMMPHKLYRRALFADHGIRFPEGRRVLWEDVYINVAAYRHAKVVSVLADTPVYLWHGSDQNSSHTFDHTRVEFWERLGDVLAFVTETLDGPDWRAARDAVLAWELGNRVIHRCVLLATDFDNADLPTRARGLKRAQRLLSHYTSDTIYAMLPKRQRAMLHLIRSGRMERIAALRAAELALTGTVRTDEVRWQDGELGFDTVTRWGPADPAVPAFRREKDRILRALPAELVAVLPPELVDVTDDAPHLLAQLAIRSRPEYVTWKLAHDTEPAAFGTDERGALALLQRGRSRVELDSSAYGRPLEQTVWDVRVKSDWLGLDRRGPLLFDGLPAPALRAGRPAVAYSNNLGGLSLDLAQRLRTFAIDAAPRSGPAGELDALSMPLDNVAVFGEAELGVDTLVAVDEAKVPADVPDAERDAALEQLAAGGGLSARVVADEQGARLEAKAALAPGEYTIYARREGRLRRTERTLRVGEDGKAELD